MNHLINGVVNATWNKLSSGVQILLVAGLLLVIVLLVWFYGAKVKNNLSEWWFNRSVAQEQKELQESKALAADLLQQLIIERTKREAAEKVLADKHLTSEEKLKAYEEAINASITPTPVTDTDALCERARALGVPCE